MEGTRIGSRQLLLLEECLSERDRAVLQSLADHRYLLTGQVQRLHFASHRTESAGIRACVRALDRLRGLDLITRLERRIGGRDSGSRGFVWTLTSAGDRLVRRGNQTLAPRRRQFEPTALFLEHTLAVAEARVELEEAARSGRFELLRVETEPSCWRAYVAPHGAPAVLKPDLAFETASGNFEDHWLLEVDRGTESIRTVLAKCAQYEAYRRSGREQAASGVFPLVVWSVPDEGRRERLEDELSRVRDLDPEIFRVIGAHALVALVAGDSPPPGSSSTHQSTPRHERRAP